MNISVLISSYGANRWSKLAENRALPSTEGQGAHEVLVLHEPRGTIATCRNNNAARATGGWLCLLDADDELAPGYLDAITRSHLPEHTDRCLYAPMVQYVEQSGRRGQPMFWPATDLRTGNWLVIGTVISKQLFTEIGGFHEGDPHGLEDFALWGEAYKRGAQPVKVPDAVYVAYRHGQSSHAKFMSNRAVYMREYHRIIERVWG